MTPVSVVVVEDNDSLREMMVELFLSGGHNVHGVCDANGLDEVISKEWADVVILDIHLPGEDGLSICRRLRASSPRVGIILMSARTAPWQRVEGYENGADIYISKPVNNEELVAAVQSVARRAARDRALEATEPQSFAYQAVTSRMQVRGPSSSQSLSHSEFALLRGLGLAANRQLEYWQMLDLLGLPDSAEGKAALEVRVARLRKKLVACGADEPAIKAIRGVGYQLMTPVVVV